MSEIVLAYSSIDKARGEAVAKVMGALGYTVAPQPVTAAQVEACKALIVFWSSGSVNSIPINQFAQQASLSKKLVSVRAGHADPPAAFALVALHDLSRWTGSLEAPELRTFLQHVLRKAPPASAPPQPNFAGALPARAPAPPGTPFNFAGPMGASMRPEAQRAAAQQMQPAQQHPVQPPPQPITPQRPMALAPEPPAQPRPQPAPARAAPAEDRRALRDRPSIRRAEERRRAAGGGAARVAFGAIAVSVIAGAAVAAFNYEPGQQTASAPQPPTSAKTVVAVTPNTFAPPTVSDAQPEPPVAAGVQVAAATPLPAPLATPEAPVAVQSARGWTASLPTLPVARPAPTPVSAGAPARSSGPRNVVASGPLTPVDASAPRPAPTDLVAIDHANLGGGEQANAFARPRNTDEERARQAIEYGPER
jgi:hypothetical protein